MAYLTANQLAIIDEINSDIITLEEAMQLQVYEAAKQRHQLMIKQFCKHTFLQLIYPDSWDRIIELGTELLENEHNQGEDIKDSLQEILTLKLSAAKFFDETHELRKHLNTNK